MLMSGFEKMVSTKTVIGEPFVIGEVTLIPIISATVGLGGGGGEGTAGDETKGKAGGVGEGLGAGFRVSPVGVVVIKGDDVTLLPVRSRGSWLEKLMETLPSLAGKIKMGKGKSGDQASDEECCPEEEDEKA
jgi:uncharacterized spore protein YtfJ